MSKLLIYLIFILFIFPLYGCQNKQTKVQEADNKTYINNFELIQENSLNDTRIKITSPKAIMDPSSNDIKIFDSSIQIINENGQAFEVKSNNSTLNNSKNLIRAYDSVNISPLEDNKSFIKTNSLDWYLNTSEIYFNNPLHINLNNTKIISLKGYYNIDLGQLEANNNIINKSILNNDGKKIYQIEVTADFVKWLKDSNSLEFTSNNKQVETIIDILAIE